MKIDIGRLQIENMDRHDGQIIEYTVRKHGYSITDLAAELQINRRTIYNYFQNKYLKYDVIHKIGLVIRHDFSKEFPDMFTGEEFVLENNDRLKALYSRPVQEENLWKDKYISLLADYNSLLKRELVYQ